MGKVNIKINDIPLTVDDDLTILKAARLLDIKIPTLCYLSLHIVDDSKIHASCRVCVVEVKGRRNLVPSCSTKVTEGMEIYTHTKRVIRARRTVMELLLSDHPQNCAMCDKNQKCQLQKIAADMNIRETPYVGEVSKKSEYIRSSTIKRNPAKCILCGNCVEVCNKVQGVGVLTYYDRGFKTQVGPAFESNLDETKCVSCGQCVNVCPTGALSQTNQVARVWNEIHNPSKHVIVQIAPAIRVSIGEEFGYELGTAVTGKLITALRRIGFDKVFDTNFAADLTIMEEGNELLNRVKENKNLPLLTSCCPGWIDYIEKNYPRYLHLPSTAKSPHEMFGAIAKSYYAEKAGIDPKNIVVVSVMPCLAKKNEANRIQLVNDNMQNVDYVLTTRELANMIKETGMRFDTFENGVFDNPLGESTGAADIFGASGGVLEAAIRNLKLTVEGKVPNIDFKEVRGYQGFKEATITLDGKEIKVAAVSGLSNAKRIMEEIKSGKSPYVAVEVMACPGGCINGGGQPFHNRKMSRTIIGGRIKGLYNQDSSKKERISMKNPYIQKLYDEYLGEVGEHKAHELLHTHFEKK